MSKIVTVFGATGHQGGCVIRTILNDLDLSKEFKIRGVTRDASKPEAQALAKQGIGITTADMNSKDSLRQALQNSHSVFLVTTPAWGTAGSDAELVHGKNVVDVAKEAGVEHLIFSSLLHVTGTTAGRLKHVPHFDQKAEVERYIRSLGVPATFVLREYFMTNYSMIGFIWKGENGIWTLAYPVGKEAKFPLIDISADMGKYVAASLRNRSATPGTQLLGAEDYYTPTRILEEFEQVTGNKTQFVLVDPETYKSFIPGPMGQEMLENHLFIESPGYFNGKSLEESKELVANARYKLTTWKEFLEQNKNLFAWPGIEVKMMLDGGRVEIVTNNLNLYQICNFHILSRYHMH
ncbi:NmrA family transcriptional regulator [Aspergillus sclerotioniger CBS 115572]|uniref:NmrA family transcriptional regulator n=1 Tax=Aspergillus sclerotioniger CBS 115572 TaxID=1450535 RepID=A0A317UYI7_9EURO|nr:NmrA family transcriptional regulator [Aspergillus sclerotioniger CBS 115572]PWY67124.1 NmrA family transcriptional regulator [Aspergillus sclerotioniger CBS 115572]